MLFLGLVSYQQNKDASLDDFSGAPLVLESLSLYVSKKKLKSKNTDITTLRLEKSGLP